MPYFDNAATTYPKPRRVLRSVEQAVTFYGGNPGRGGHKMAMRVSEKIYSVRKKAADFFHADAENVIFTSNCTMATNMALKGVLREGDHVICSCLEHNAVLRPIYKLSQTRAVEYDIAQVYEYDDDRTVASFESLIRENTRAIVCTHTSNVSGMILPIQKLGELCRRRGIIFIVDAAQSAGVLPIDMQECGINLLCMPGHKGLYGVTGSGMLILNDIDGLDTILEGGTGSLSAEVAQPDFYPDRLESGTVNTVGILSIDAGLDFIQSVGIERIYRHEFGICRKVYDRLRRNPAIELYTSDFLYGKNAPIVCFNVCGINSDVLVAELAEYGYALRGGLHCAPLAHEYYGTLDRGMARFAPSYFTHDTEVEQFLKKLEIISKKLHNSLEL